MGAHRLSRRKLPRLRHRHRRRRTQGVTAYDPSTPTPQPPRTSKLSTHQDVQEKNTGLADTAQSSQNTNASAGLRRRPRP